MGMIRRKLVTKQITSLAKWLNSILEGTNRKVVINMKERKIKIYEENNGVVKLIKEYPFRIDYDHREMIIYEC